MCAELLIFYFVGGIIKAYLIFGGLSVIVKPVFFDTFKCVAADCTDTCCSGWEIDVDGDTLELYNSLRGDVGAFVRERLIYNDCTKLCLEGKRCRFLREDNLCELIIRLGEDSLCDICREHPRFYSESENICEVGLGLCCPEAARLWLESPAEFITADDAYAPAEEELKLLSRQLELIEFLAYGEGTLGERLYLLLGGAPKRGDAYKRLCALYASLEALDDSFGKSFTADAPCAKDSRFTRLAAYFVYRYYLLLGEELSIKFTAASLVMIAAMGGEITEKAKDYSKEVEYDPDNLERIYELLGEIDSLGALCRDVLCV